MTENVTKFGENFLNTDLKIYKHYFFANEQKYAPFFCGILSKSRGSSVGIALAYGLDDRCFRVGFPAGTGKFSLHHRIQNGSEAHLASYPIGTTGSFPGGKAAGS
jgi:hypothetical protein